MINAKFTKPNNTISKSTHLDLALFLPPSGKVVTAKLCLMAVHLKEIRGERMQIKADAICILFVQVLLLSHDVSLSFYSRNIPHVLTLSSITMQFGHGASDKGILKGLIWNFLGSNKCFRLELRGVILKLGSPGEPS